MTETAAMNARPADTGRPARPHAAAPARAGRQEVTALAYARLRELIVSGRLAPGAPLIETDLSKRLGVSRTPVRAALQRLQQERFVTGVSVGQMLRVVVAPLTAEDMREVFLMAGALESAAARLAAGLEPRRRGEVVAEMERLNAELRAASESRPPDLVRAQDAHARLHRAFSAAGAGPRLRAELDVLQPQAERYERVYTSAIIFAFEESLDEHRAIIDALRAGDADRAEEAVARNWRGCARRYRQVVTILGERGNW
jgi:DNA-binding GntR family transcriptional regulator